MINSLLGQSAHRGRLCPRSSVVEHFFGKEEVMGPIPIEGSILAQRTRTEALRLSV